MLPFRPYFSISRPRS